MPAGADRSVIGDDLHFDAPAGPLYVARRGALCVEVGCRLRPFVDQLLAGWEADAGDVAVWLHQGGATRLVAVLRDSPGGPRVTWL